MGKRTKEAKVRELVAACVGALLVACADGGVPGKVADGGQAWIRGRVTDVEGAPLADMEVSAEGVSARTDSRGRFQLLARVDREVRVLVKSEQYSSAELPVSVAVDGGAQLELAVKRRRLLTLRDGASGGRAEGDDGFALQLPAAALRDEKGAPVQGEVEVRYATISRPREVTAAPGRMQASDGASLDGFGMAEVSFYQRGKRLKLMKDMQVELPLYDGHGLADGQEVDQYQLGEQALRWSQSARGRIKANRVVLSASRDQWIGAAKALPAASCVKGRLGVPGDRRVANTTVRAARGRGLSLVQAETSADGSFCLPVTADDDWRVSTFFDDGEESFGLQVELRSDVASGMCGGSGCKDVGDVALGAME